MSEWVKLCTRAELPAEGHAKEFALGEKTLCVAVRGGRPMALDNVCPHRGGPLAEGTIEGGKIVCPWHQWEFDLATGAATHTTERKATVYAVRQEGEDVFVEL